MARVDMPAWATLSGQTAMQEDITQIRSDVAALAAKYSSIVVTCATLDETEVTGQTVTLRAGTGAGAPVYDTRPYNGQPVTFEVPRGFRYFVEVSSTLAGHYNPTTAVGTATTGTVAVTLTYSDIDHITTYADIEAAIRSMGSQAEGRAALVGIEIADTWEDVDGTLFDDPKVCVDVQPVRDPQGSEHLAAIMMPKYCTKYDVQFDAPEIGPEAYATEAAAIGGYYYWGYGPVYTQKTYAVNAFCSYRGGIFKCTTAVSAAEEFDETKWQLLDSVYYDSGKTYAVGDYARVGAETYQCTTAVSAAEEFDEAKWSLILTASAFQSGAMTHVSRNTGQTIDYTAYGAMYHTDISSSYKDYLMYGYNNWELSAQRQYLNSTANEGEWWYAQHVGDCPPANLGEIKGYMAGCSEALLSHARQIRVPVFPWGQSAQYTVDTFWLPSATEMYGVANDNEGHPFKFVEDACNTALAWTSANNGNNAARIYRRVNAKTSAANVRLRSANRSNSYNAWYVSTSGGVNSSGGSASNAYASLPACAIY